MPLHPGDDLIGPHMRACGCAACREADGGGGSDSVARTSSTTGLLTDSIDWGSAVADTTVTVYFVPPGERLFTGFGEFYTAEGFNAYEKAQFQKAFDRIAAVADLDFQIVTGSAAGETADFKLILDTNESADFLGFFNPPGEEAAGIGVFNGDFWDRQAGRDLEEGGFGFVTIVHELLHGLGLAHPHDDGGGSPQLPGVRFEDDLGRDDLNQGVYTIMGYNSGFQTGGAGSKPPFSGFYGYEAGPMALDIAVLQAKYGAVAARTGDSSYVLPGNNNTGTMWQAIWDTGGVDEMRYTGRKDARLDLRAATLEAGEGGGGFVSSAKGVAGGWTIAHGVMIEDARGGAGDDWISGNAGANRLRGQDGNDQIRGRDGADLLQGGAGRDALWGARGKDRLEGDAGHDRLFGGAGADRLEGGRGRDELSGGGGRDRLLGKAGADRLEGGARQDTLNGGAGEDALFGGAGDDVLRGKAQDDLLLGGAGADDLFGGAGADVFRFRDVTQSGAGAAARDRIMDFGAGRDLIDLARIDAVTGQGGNQAFSFIGTRALSDAGDLRVMQQGPDWLVRGDVDGDGNADIEILLRGADRPVAADFIL